MRIFSTILLIFFSSVEVLGGTYTVTNTNNSGGGSLNRAISDANGGGAGPHLIQFAIDTTDSNYDPSRGVFTITLTSLLPVLTRDAVTIDATTQVAAFGNTNTGQLGSGGTVGTDSVTLAKVEAPEIEIVDGGGLARCFNIRADNTTIRGFAMYGFGTDPTDSWHGAIVCADWTVVFDGGLIEQNIIGCQADTILDPNPGSPITSRGISFVRTTGYTIQNNIIGFIEAPGIELRWFANNHQVINNEVRNCGIGSPNYDGIGLGDDAYDVLVSENLIYDNGALGLDSWQIQGSMTYENNTITGNGISYIAGQEEGGIRLFGTGNTVRKNIITNNQGPGVSVIGQDGGVSNAPSNQNLISQNHFSGNEKNAIDLMATGSDRDQGDGITLNDAAPTSCGTLATSGNDGLDFPVIDSAKYFLGSGFTVVYGRACPNSIIEIYSVESGSGDTLSSNVYGEGTWYIDSTTTNGSGIFVKSVTGLDSSDYISSLVIASNNNTSEFSENLKVILVAENCGNAIDDDGDGLVDCLDTTDCRPSKPGAITISNATVCEGQAGEVYSISSLPDASSYSWSVPSGASITSGQGTTSVTVTWGSVQGSVCVIATNGFCNSLITCQPVLMKYAPTQPAGILH